MTPMMAQYLEIKADHQDALLFYRMGDFYEMFFDDAVAASAALDIALTKRGKHDNMDIPMCGVPVHAAETYLQTLLRKGFRVAVCEQLEDPAEAKKRGYKAVVKRGVTRLATAGTLTEDSLLDARQHSFLAAWSEIRNEGALAWVDISTGELRVSPCPRVMLAPQLARLSPREILVTEATEPVVSPLVSELDCAMASLGHASFDSRSAEKRLCALYKVASLEAFATLSRAEVSALGAIIDYLDITQKGNLPLIRRPQREDPGGMMAIDAATRRNLEITHSLSGGRAGSLLSTIDRTVTAPGARLLDRRISNPSCDLAEIHARLAAVDALVDEPTLREDIRTALKQVPDMDRALARLSLDRGGPRDLSALRNGLEQAASLTERLDRPELPDRIKTAKLDLLGHETVLQHLSEALVAEPALLTRDGGFIAEHFDSELDEMRTLRDEGRGVIAALQARYADETGITALKVKHNNVLGYFIETPATHASKMLGEPASETFIHRQTTANAVRFTTLELSDLERKIQSAGARALEIEKRIFEELRGSVLDTAVAIGTTARALAELDLTAAFADLAAGSLWCKPEVDDSRAFDIVSGRHPVVEAAIRQQTGESFIANNCELSATDGAAICLLTGPNMAGKSTWLRQNALIALLAQSGSFVPAQSARIGVVSQLFSRVGAADDLARGRSTFMVEMVETAAILNQAGSRSLVILDEIGRGTATYDGLSIAWATLEHLHETNRCRALFATHYHELTALADKLDHARNATVAVKEWEGDVVFLHEIRDGAADRSYGVQVAKLAGLPQSVVDRARTVLDSLEQADREGGSRPVLDDLPLFSHPAAPPPASRDLEDPVVAALAEVAPDQLTPIDALNLVYQLKALSDGH